MRTRLWDVAKHEVKACGRCKDWQGMGLGDRCPSCDHKILLTYERLVRFKKKLLRKVNHGHDDNNS